VVREALMLLEEDGLVVTRRGVGRFVADQLPETGLEELRPFEEVLATQRTAMTVRVGELVLQAATPYTAGHLGIDEAANTWFCESVVESGGRPVAIVQEHLPAGRYLSDASRLVASNLEQAHADQGTILAVLIVRCGPIFSSGICEVTANVVGASRGQLLNLGATAPVLILTQTVLVGTHAAYVAKCIISSEVGHLEIFQSGSPA
jgi:GntR family transcriptional regulator